MDLELARRIVAQDALTSKLLGVDFVPAYRSESLDSEAILSAGGTAADPAAIDEVNSIDPARSVSAARAAKSAANTSPAAGFSLTSQPANVPSSAALFEAKPLPTATNTASDAAAAAIAPGISTPRDPTRTAADVERDLATIRADYEHDAPHRAFGTTFNNIVFGEGNPLARIMFVGEAPGEEEDKTGRPFVGRAGQLLDKMIVGMGLKRSDVYIANILKTRPPNNATPTVDECIICMPYIARQIAAIRPEAIVTLGLTSTKALLRTDLTMSRMRGVWASYKAVDGVLIPVMPTFHPAYVLRAYTDENRQKVWSDLKLVLQRLELPVPARA